MFPPINYVKRWRGEFEDDVKNYRAKAIRATQICAENLPMKNIRKLGYKGRFLDKIDMVLTRRDYEFGVCWSVFSESGRQINIMMTATCTVHASDIDFKTLCKACSYSRVLQLYRCEITGVDKAVWTLVHPSDQILVVLQMLPPELARCVFSYL